MAPKLLRRPASASEVEDLKKRVEKLEVEKEQEKRKREKLEEVVRVVRVRVDILSNDNHDLYHRVGAWMLPSTASRSMRQLVLSSRAMARAKARARGRGARMFTEFQTI